VELQLHAFLNSALDGGEWLALLPGRLTPRERAPATQWIGGCVGLKAGLKGVVNRKNSQPFPGLETSIIQPVAYRCTTELSH
jgi:hypothetical protein